MTTPLPWDRAEYWTAHVVNPDGTRSSLDLDADQPGSITWDGSRQTPVSATLHCLGAPPVLIEDQRIALTLWVDDTPHLFPALVPAKDDPVYEYDSWFQLQAADETLIFALDGVDHPVVYDVAQPIVAAQRTVLANSAPDVAVALPDSSHTLRNQLGFGLGASPLSIVNALAEAINATPLAPTLGGSLESHLWTPPTDRPVEMTFGPREVDAGYEHRVDLQRFHLEAPNVQHYLGTGSASSAQIVGRWRDEDPASPYSIPRRRRRILGPRRDGDAATQTIADALARRAGLEARGRGRQATITGLWQPLQPGQVIQTRNPLHPDLDATWEIQALTVTVGGEASDTTWRLREVV